MRGCLAVLAVVGLATGASAQQRCDTLAPGALSGVRHDIAAAVELGDTSASPPPLFRRGSLETDAGCALPEWAAAWAEAPLTRRLGPVELSAEPMVGTLEYNSAYPRDRLNGALWAGRGVSGAFSLGASARWRWLSASVRPLLMHQQNDEFRTVAASMAGYSPLIYPWYDGRIDWPQRFGHESMQSVELASSYVRADVGAFALGVSNENLWWGPAQRYPIVIGNNAAGFPHAFVGTAGAVPWFGGHWQAEVFWGRLEESEFFDVDASNDHRLFSGLVLAFSPGFIPGLTLGGARTFSTVAYPDRFGALDYVLEPFRDVGTNEPAPIGDDQLIAAYMRWHLPRAGFDVWAEWARGDGWAGAGDLLREIDHTQSYTLGVAKLVELDNGAIRLLGELSDTERSTTEFSHRATPVMFTNAGVRQGHTHRGQLLGSPLGPGSNAQTIVVDWIAPIGLLGFEIERARYDASAYYPRFADQFGFHGHDIEVTGALRAGHSAEDWDVVGRVGYSYRGNRNFATLPDLLLTDFDFRFPVDRNWSVGLEARWKPRGERRNDPTRSP